MIARDPQSAWFRGRESAAGLGSSVPRYGLAADALRATRPEHACTVGCTFCCHFPVGVRHVEVAAIAVQLRAFGSELPAIRERITAEARTRARLGWDSLANERRPCPLLNATGACLVHSRRPLACRGWNSFDRTSCEREFEGEPGVRIELDGELHLATLGLASGLDAALAEAGRDSGHYELVTALALLLHDSRASLAEGALRVGQSPAG